MIVTACVTADVIDIAPVSYTHLDVYKRQEIVHATVPGGFVRRRKRNTVRQSNCIVRHDCLVRKSAVSTK